VYEVNAGTHEESGHPPVAVGRNLNAGIGCKDGVEIYASLCASKSASVSGAASKWKDRTYWWSAMVRGIIDSAADRSTSGAVKGLYSLTSGGEGRVGRAGRRRGKGKWAYSVAA
jgi:hypothetical protein